MANRFFADATGAHYASGAGYADALGGGAAAVSEVCQRPSTTWDVVLHREDAPTMTFDGGYALGPQDALEALDMGGGSVLSLKVTGQ